jgi:tetratricopeptide (TPR) repeat protein
MELYDYEFHFSAYNNAKILPTQLQMNKNKVMTISHSFQTPPHNNYSSLTLRDNRKHQPIANNKRKNSQLYANYSYKYQNKRPKYGNYNLSHISYIYILYSDFEKTISALIDLAEHNFRYQEFLNALECLEIKESLIRQNYESDLNLQLVNKAKRNKQASIELRCLSIKSQILFGMKKYDKAIDCFKNLLDLDANHFEALRSLAICYLRVRLFKESGECIKRLGSIKLDSFYLRELFSK